MEETTPAVWMWSVILGVMIPLFGWFLWWWNELWYAVPAMKGCAASGSKLPPGHMGFPYFGEMFSFFWYFKVVRRPDDYINSLRWKYGDGVGMYRTHLFGRPSIIACFPMVNKFVLQSDDTKFGPGWPNAELMGKTSLITVQGMQHLRARTFVVNAINKPDALRRITLLVQPRIVEALQSWAAKGRIVAYKESKKVTFENIGKIFASTEPGPELEELLQMFDGVVKGVRAFPLNIPGTAYHHALKVHYRITSAPLTFDLPFGGTYALKNLISTAWKMLEEIFEERMMMKKKTQVEGTEIDLLDGLMQVKDEEGNRLSDREVVDNIVSLVIGGFESTTLSIMWAIYYLAKYPKVLEKLREECTAISKSRNGEFITCEDVKNMKYTSKVIEETIRLANIALLAFRNVKNDIDYKGYRIPKNWNVILWLRYLHTNPENFDDPLCFNPDRWDKMAKPGTYQVFGGGARICAGNMLVRYQLAILLHHLSLGYRWELVNPNVDFVYLPHNKPADGVEITICKL